MRKRRFKILLLVLLMPVVLLCVFLLFERFRGQISLALYKRELIAKGEKLTFAELIPAVPEGENGAPEVQAAIKRLHKGAVLPDNPPPVMKLTPAGRAVIGFHEDVWVSDVGLRDGEWISDKITNTWEQLAAELKTNEFTLAETRAALAKPSFNNNLNYAETFKMQFLHLVPAKSLTHWLGAASQFALREGRHQKSLDNLIAEIRLPRLLAEDRLVISELVRIAIAGIARTATWEALQADGWTDGQLAQLQEAWQSNDFVANMASSLSGERAFCQATYEPLRRSNEDAVAALSWGDVIPFFVGGESHPAWWRDIVTREMYCRIWRFSWSHQDECFLLKKMQNLIEIARRAADDKSAAMLFPVIEQFNEQCMGGYYHQLRFHNASQSLTTISGTLKRAMRADTERTLVICAIALKRYSIRHGKQAGSLDALVPEFLSSVPTDYMDGKPLKYRLNADRSFTLYSVGEDGKDDSGDMTPVPDKMRWNSFWARRDVVWPSPATPEEVEAYRKEAAKN